jgi:hypothetical protein
MEYFTDQEIFDVIQTHKNKFKSERYFLKILESIPAVTWSISKEDAQTLKSSLSYDEIRLNPHLTGRRIKEKTYSNQNLKTWLKLMAEAELIFNEDLIFNSFKWNSMTKSKKRKNKIPIMMEEKKSKIQKTSNFEEIQKTTEDVLNQRNLFDGLEMKETGKAFKNS